MKITSISIALFMSLFASAAFAQGADSSREDTCYDRITTNYPAQYVCKNHDPKNKFSDFTSSCEYQAARSETNRVIVPCNSGSSNSSGGEGTTTNETGNDPW